MSDKDSERLALHEMIDGRDAEIMQLREYIASRDADLAELQTKLNASRHNAERWQDNAVTTKAALAEKKRELELAEDAREGLRRVFEEVVKERDAARAECERLKAESLFDALRRHVNTEMDQWEMWRLTSAFGNTAYIKISYYPHDGADAEAYDNLDDMHPTPAPSGASPDTLAEMEHRHRDSVARYMTGPQLLVGAASPPAPADLVERARTLLTDIWSACGKDDDICRGASCPCVNQITAALAAVRDEASRKAYERAARLVEQTQESHRADAHGDGYYLSPRRRGNLIALAYAEGIRALSDQPQPDTTEGE